MLVNVTQQHLDLAREKSDCPLSIALTELTGQEWDTTSNSTMVKNITIGKNYVLPYHITMILWSFDNGNTINPFSFELV